MNYVYFFTFFIKIKTNQNKSKQIQRIKMQWKKIDYIFFCMSVE